MTQRVFVEVLGCSAAERHALNTLFRLSEQRGTVYSLWEPQMQQPPRLLLVDGRSEAAHGETVPADKSLKLIWIGSVAPASSWRSFERPLLWPNVIQAMDELFAPPGSLDLDLDLDDSPQTLPPGVRGWNEAPPMRALIASGDRDQRLYLRARLALAELTQVDEAQTGAEALEMARANPYCVALVDFGLPDVDGWTLLRALHAERPAIAHLIATKTSPSLVERLRARWGGAAVMLSNPPQPATLRSALEKVGRHRVGHPGFMAARHPL